jgi:hypothetical protein
MTGGRLKSNMPVALALVAAAAGAAIAGQPWYAATLLMLGALCVRPTMHPPGHLSHRGFLLAMAIVGVSIGVCGLYWRIPWVWAAGFGIALIVRMLSVPAEPRRPAE